MENNGKGIFYGVIGVATLIVAIIGATFAYFSATAENTGVITGNAARAGLDLQVRKVSTDAAGDLIPLNDADVAKGLAGDSATSNKKCVDKNGNTVCQIYEIKVTNSGSSSVVLKGNMTLSATTFQNLKWQLLTGNEEASIATNSTYNPSSKTELVASETLSSSGSKKYYVMIWISNKEADQSSQDTGTFTGTVKFDSADGRTGVSASFSS